MLSAHMDEVGFMVNYIDDKGNTEEIGIPEIWKETTDVPTTPEGPMINTSIGSFKKDASTAYWLFWKLMKGRAWKFDDLKREFCTQYNVHYGVFNDLRAMITESIVKDDVSVLWYYQGPSFSPENAAGDF